MDLISQITSRLMIGLGHFFDSSVGRPFALAIATTVRLTLPSVLTTLVVPAELRSRCRLFIRGSLVTPVDFNPIYSDWDLGFSFSLDVDLERAPVSELEFAKICQIAALKVQRLRRFIWPLGEIEFYRDSEHAELLELIAKTDRFYENFRSARKLTWIAKAHSRASGLRLEAYQNAKAERAIRNCFTRLGLQPTTTATISDRICALKRVLDLKFGKIEAGTKSHWPGAVYHAYLDFEIPAFALNEWQIVTLFATCPPSEIPEENLNSKVIRARQNPAIHSLFKTMTRIETLTLVAVMRGFFQPNSEYQIWLNQLRDGLRESTELR